MKTAFTAAALALTALSLSACGGKGDDKLGDNIEQAADNRADALEARADNLEEQADTVRDKGEVQSEAVDDADVNAAAMSDDQKAALVNGSTQLR